MCTERGAGEGSGAALRSASEQRLARHEDHEEMVADDRFSVHDANVGAVGIASRVLALVVVAVAYLVVAYVVVWSSEPHFVPSALLDAQMRAMAGAAERGDESICGVPILSASDGVQGSATATLEVVDVDTARQAACLHQGGYLDDAGLAAVLAFEDDREPRWWEAVLVAAGFVAVVGSATVLLFRRQREGGPRYPSVGE